MITADSDFMARMTERSSFHDNLMRETGADEAQGNSDNDVTTNDDLDDGNY